MKLINVQSQSKHAASTMCKSCCALFLYQSCTCVAIQRDGVKTQFASNMQCNYYLLRKISFRMILCIWAEVALRIDTRLHHIAVRVSQILYKYVIAFLRFLQAQVKHCCMNAETASLILANRRKSQFLEKNNFDTHFDAESFCSHLKPLLHFVQIGCESRMNASCITFVVARIKL